MNDHPVPLADPVVETVATAAKRHCAKLEELLSWRVRSCLVDGHAVHADDMVQALTYAIAAVQREAARETTMAAMLALVEADT